MEGGVSNNILKAYPEARRREGINEWLASLSLAPFGFFMQPVRALGRRPVVHYLVPGAPQTDWYEVFAYENIHGIPLIEAYDGPWLTLDPKGDRGTAAWQSLLDQLALILYVLDREQVRHHDLWDANVILQPTNATSLTLRLPKRNSQDREDARGNARDKRWENEECGDECIRVPLAGFVVRIIDLEFATHLPSDLRRSRFHHPVVSSSTPADQETRHLLGVSSVFQRGADANAILGVLLEHMPIRWQRKLRPLLREVSQPARQGDSAALYSISTANHALWWWVRETVNRLRCSGLGIQVR